MHPTHFKMRVNAAAKKKAEADGQNWTTIPATAREAYRAAVRREGV